MPLIRRRARRAFATVAVAALATGAALTLLILPLVPATFAAGPPFPSPAANQAVYDEAGVLSGPVRQQVEATIDAIRSRTGAEVVVYTQLVPRSVTTAEAEADAIALMDQWGVGRKGIDDGLVILFDLYQDDPCHGQVELYAGPGFRATYLTNEERQAIFQNDMLPYLEACDMNGALLAAMAKVDAAATPAHAQTLDLARQANAVIGLVLAPLLFLLIVGGALLRWYRTGKDPVYLDDPSILVPAPPPGLTPAAGAAVRDGGVARRSLTAASLDLAVRGYTGFRAEPGGAFGGRPEIGIFAGEAVSSDQAEQARMLRARHRPMDPATEYLRECLTAVAGGTTYIEPARITELGQYVGEFNKRLETHLVKEGWYRERPSRSSGRWVVRGTLAFLAGIAILVVGFNLPCRRRRGARRLRDRLRDRAVRHRRRHAGADAGGGGDPGHARGVPANARADDGAGAIDGPGRDRVRDPADREPRRCRCVGSRARAARGGRAGPGAIRR